MSANRYLAVLAVKDFLSVCNLVQTELLGDLRSYLGRVSVDGLAASDDEVDISDLADCRRKGIGRCKGVSSGKETAVRKKPAGVSASVEAFPDDLSCARRTHCEYSDRRAGILLLEAEGLLESIHIFRIEDCGKRCTVDCSFSRHCILPDISRVRYLLGKYYDFQTHNCDF